jgi:hypothetical protein
MRSWRSAGLRGLLKGKDTITTSRTDRAYREELLEAVTSTFFLEKEEEVPEASVTRD